jgi:hypothetical protein
MPGGRRNPHEFGGCAPDSEVSSGCGVVFSTSYRRRDCPRPPDGGRSRHVRARGAARLLVEPIRTSWRRRWSSKTSWPAARAMSTIGGERQVDAGSRLMKSAQRVLKAQKKAGGREGVQAKHDREEEARKEGRGGLGLGRGRGRAPCISRNCRRTSWIWCSGNCTPGTWLVRRASRAPGATQRGIRSGGTRA